VVRERQSFRHDPGSLALPAALRLTRTTSSGDLSASAVSYDRRMRIDTHVRGNFDSRFPYAAKADVWARVVDSVGEQDLSERIVSVNNSRAVSRNEIHELVFCREEPAALRTTGVCAIEIEASGVILKDDAVVVDGALVSRVIGFDVSHCPDHLDVLLALPERPIWSGRVGFRLVPRTVDSP